MYDLVIIGAGPAGLMAASTATKDGLKVLLVERKKDITATPRSCVSIFYWKFILADEYLEPITVDFGTGLPLQAAGKDSVNVNAIFRFHGPQFSVNYRGALLLYHNYIKLSPSGYKNYCIKDELWGFYFSRESMLGCLYDEVKKTQTKVITGVTAISVSNTPGGVTVRLSDAKREWNVEARKALVADGICSSIVDSLGLNINRTGKREGVVGFILDGVQPEIYDHGAWLSFDIPSISPRPVYCGFHAEDGKLNLRHLVGDSANTLRKLMNDSCYAPWFRQARVVRTTGFGGMIYSPPLSNPTNGNVLVIGDAVSAECFIQGAIACGYQGAKASLKEINGENGYRWYTEWLHKAFSFYRNGEHIREKIYGHIFPLVHPDDADIDYLYRILARKNYTGHPAIYLAHHPEIFKRQNPDLYNRIKRAVAEINTKTVR